MSLNLGIVIPCYNEEAVLRETTSRVLEVLDRLRRAGQISEASSVYFVDDGSRDNTWRLIEELAQVHHEVIGIKLSRNRGHQNALIAGLLTAEGDALVSIDADLQDDVTVIETMVAEHLRGLDVVYGVRRKRTTDTFFKRSTAGVFYRLMNAMGAETIPDHADFRLLSRRAIEALRSFGEVNIFLRGIVPLIGFEAGSVYYDRGKRFAGESKYPLRKMLEFALDAITSFSTVPLRLITGLGLAVFAFTVLVSAWILWVRLTGDKSAPGWASTTLPLLFVGGAQILCLGVIGEYLGKVYIETKQRPRFFVQQVARGARGAKPMEPGIDWAPAPGQTDAQVR